MAHRPLARLLLHRAHADLRRLARVRGAHRRTARRIAEARGLLALAALLLGTEPARAQAPPEFLNPWHPFGLKASSAVGHRLAFGDLDADGYVDVVDSFFGDLEVYRNAGSRRKPFFTSVGSNPFGLTAPGDFAPIAFADLDGDGDLDLVAGLPDGSTYLLLNTGTATEPAFGPPVEQAALHVPAYSAPAFGDLDGDGDLDALIGQLSGTLYYFANTGTPSTPGFAAGQSNPFGISVAGMLPAPALADLDGDGDLDLLVGVYAGTTFFLANTGTANAPAFASAAGSPFGIEIHPLGPGPSLADLDFDGDLDLVIADGSGSTVFYRNTGSATEPAFRHASRAFGLGETVGSAPAFGDLDGDGDLDALVGNAEGVVFSAPNFGSASSPEFLIFEVNSFGIGAGVYAQPAIADLDGDGDLDVLLGDDTSGGRLLYFVNTGSAGAASFAAAQTNPFCSGSLGVRPTPDFVDFGDDGDLDLALSYTDGRVDVCTNTGTATVPEFAGPQTNPFSIPNLGAAASLAFGDIFANGAEDVLVGNDNGLSSVLFNLATDAEPSFGNFEDATVFGIQDLGTFSNPTFADLDADGDEDALVGANDGPGSGRTVFFENLAIELLCPPAPREDCAEAVSGALTVDERKTGKEKLTFSGKLGTPVTPELYDDPLEPGGAEYAVCLYDGHDARIANLRISRAGELCAPNQKPCWRSLGQKGFAFKDKLGGSAGFTALTLGTKKVAGTASNRAAQGRTALPTGLAARLANSDRAVVQLYVAGGRCVSASLPQVKKQTPTFFKARSS